MHASTIQRAAIVAALFTLSATPRLRPQGTRFEVTVAASTHGGPVTGRLLVIIAKTARPEPRLAVSPSGPALFAIDLEQWAADKPAIVDESALGYPMALSALPEGDYFAQAFIHVYEPVKRGDGHTLWLHMNDGRQEPFNIAAGNLFSEVVPYHHSRDGGAVGLTIDHAIPPLEADVDSEWVKHVKIQSRKLTEFWGRPIHVHATVLLPRGHAEHPDVAYPCIYTLGHNTPFSFTTEPAKSPANGVLHPVTGLESGFDFQRAWLADGFPRVIAISFEQQTPFFPDSYSVNSANNGPYGDAVIEEVIPELERRFRIIPESYARHVEGASTGGWQTLALQLQHPDYFGGAWVLQPDPIDFRRYQMVDIYKDENAFEVPAGQFGVVERPFRRTTEGQAVWSVRQLSRFEETLGTHGRSGYQLEGWEAVYGPIDADGYPRPLWNKLTGKIDREVAESMRAHGYDLRDYAERHWSELGPKLAGKLHLFAGDMDDFYLNVAVYRFEEFLKSTTHPTSDAEFNYGRPMKGHSWHAFPWSELVRRFAAAVRRNAPEGKDTSVWNY